MDYIDISIGEKWKAPFQFRAQNGQKWSICEDYPHYVEKYKGLFPHNPVNYPVLMLETPIIGFRNVYLPFYDYVEIGESEYIFEAACPHQFPFAPVETASDWATYVEELKKKDLDTNIYCPLQYPFLYFKIGIKENSPMKEYGVALYNAHNLLGYPYERKDE